jgi:Na+-transporting methylmalonyl-CoA/oxaloacetate decarboxylase gamma subunit
MRARIDNTGGKSRNPKGPVTIPRLTTFLAAVSLLLFILVIALWIRSKLVNDSLYAYTNDPSSARFIVPMFDSDDGRLAFILRVYDHPSRPTPDQPWRILTRPRTAYNNVHWFWFHRMIGTPGGQPTRTEIVVRLWPLTLLLSLPPLLGLARRLFRKPPSGVCRKCHYSLQGNTSGICPECGTVVRLPGVQSSS